MRCLRRAKTRNEDSYDWKVNDHDTDSPTPSCILLVQVHSLENLKIKKNKFVPTTLSLLQVQDVSARIKSPKP